MGLLRFFLAVAVVLSHGRGRVFGTVLTAGQLSVQAFYVISGFVIAMVMTEHYSRQRQGTRLFLMNRVLRLWPSFFVVGGLTVAGYFVSRAATGQPIVMPHSGMGDIVHFWDVLTPFSRLMITLPNIFMVGSDWLSFWVVNSNGLRFQPTYVGPDDVIGLGLMVLPQAWTLGVEMSFYAIAPWLLRRSWKVWAITCAASLLLRAVTYYGLGFTNGVWSYRVFPQELALFLAGSLSYRAYVWLRGAASDRLLKVGGCVAGAVLLGLLSTHEERIAWRYWTFLIAMPLGLPFLYHLTGRNRLDRWLGELSYPIYLVHLSLLPYVGAFIVATNYQDSQNLLFPICSVVAGIALYYGIDRPVTAWRHTRLRSAAPGVTRAAVPPESAST